MREAARVGVPGVTLTQGTHRGVSNQKRSGAAGFIAHMNKPIVYEELAAIIEQVADRQTFPSEYEGERVRHKSHLLHVLLVQDSLHGLRLDDPPPCA